MKKRTFFLVLMVFVILGTNSCKNKADDLVDDCGTVWATEVQDELNAWSNAAAAYGANQTPANCNAYKAAAQAYLNALEPYRNCAAITGAQRTQWEQALASAQQSINSIKC
jgi:hypothetical protein